jgi:hypothetical protein
VGDEALIVNFKDSFFYNLSPVGTFIWERCDGTHSIAQIAAELVQDYEVDLEVAVRDCEQFIQELVAEGVLVLQQSPKSVAPEQAE